MSAWRARLAVLAVFLAGCLSGAAALHAYRARMERRILHSKEIVAQLLVYSLDRELSLSEAQRREVRDTVLALRNDLLKTRRELMPQIADVFERGQARVRAVLTEEQRKKFDAIVAERRRLMEEIGKKP